jgi:hypothetical protein
LTAKGPEKIKIPAGEFEAIRVEYTDERSQVPTQIRWYAQDIGLVQIKADDVNLTLKKFIPSKK